MRTKYIAKWAGSLSGLPQEEEFDNRADANRFRDFQERRGGYALVVPVRESRRARAHPRRIVRADIAPKDLRRA